MRNHKENQIFNKFSFLHSQESSEDISWSCSESSDNENNNIPNRNLSNITNSRKRKRINNRKKGLTNISNLDINIFDTSTKNNSVISSKSPILSGKSKAGIVKNPLIKLQSSNYQTKVPSSDYSSVTDQQSIVKSPVLNVKYNSPKVSQNARRKLFKSENCHSNKNKEDTPNIRCTSPILRSKCIIDKGKHKCRPNNNSKEEKKHFEYNEGKHNMIHRLDSCSEHDVSIEYSSSQESGPKQELVAKVKSFFDNYFSQASQQSISECETPTPKNNSKSSNDIDTTPKSSEIMALSKIPSTNTFESDMSVQKKNIRYKKGGLSYRLNLLLKKQNASVSLWQHERFLAANSNFVIPKEHFFVYRIKRTSFKFGIYLLEVVNECDEIFIAVINSFYVNNCAFNVDSILNIYEPFKIVTIDKDRKIICNVCKFECGKLKL